MQVPVISMKGTMNDENFEPLIIAFCCQYCSYSAADLAGSMRLQYPTECAHRPDALHRAGSRSNFS